MTFAIALFAGSIGWITGVFCGCVFCEKQAVEDGKAEYFLDKNHKRQWRWKKD